MSSFLSYTFLCFLFLLKGRGAAGKEGVPLIGLTERNVITLRGRIDGTSTAQLVKAFNTYEEEKVYLYITSPGGSVMEGLHIIDQIDTLAARGIAVYCIADFAASMAFAIFQACPTRYTTSASILMQHQMSLHGVKGNLYNVENYLDFVRGADTRLDQRQATRLNLTLDAFQQKIMNDWWVSGADILEYGASDAQVRVHCQPGLVHRKDRVNIEALFFEVELIFSQCPLVREPLTITIKSKDNTTLPVDLVEENIAHFLPSKYSKLHFPVYQ